VRLWACHGPSGAGLPFSYSLSGSAETWYNTPNGGCTTAAGTLRLGFLRPDPANGQTVALRLDVPTGVALRHIEIGRRATGPGYVARTSSVDLEREDAGSERDGVVSAAASGEFVELRLSCATEAERCEAPDAGVDFRFATLTVRDDTPPSLTVDGLPAPARGAVDVVVRASDAGIGLARATLSVDGQPVATRDFDPARCRELSPLDATIDLNLSLACTRSGTMTFPLDTTGFADGEHRLEVSVVDGAGNRRTSQHLLRVQNAVSGGPPMPPAPPAPPARPAATPRPPVPTTRQLVRLPKRLVVSRRGTVTLSVLCPATATQPCRHQLELIERGLTVAKGRGTAAPGRRVRITLKLSRAARRTLARRHRLDATLSLLGARGAVAVRLRT
jgi:hypothetical protein